MDRGLMEGILPVDDLLRQLVLALGAAMIVGSIAVIIRERRRRDEPDDRPKPNMRVVTLQIVIGLVLAVWGLGSILAAR